MLMKTPLQRSQQIHSTTLPHKIEKSRKSTARCSYTPNICKTHLLTLHLHKLYDCAWDKTVQHNLHCGCHSWDAA